MQPTENETNQTQGQVITPTGSTYQPPVQAQPIVEAPAVTQPEVSHKSLEQVTSANTKSGKIKRVVIGIVAILIFAGGYAANNGVSALGAVNAKSAGKAMVAALVAGDKSKAYGMVSADVRNQQTEDAFLQSIGDVQTTKPDYSDETIQVSGKSAVYVTSVNNLPANDNGDTSSTLVISLSKSGLNSWKVDDVSVQ